MITDAQGLRIVGESTATMQLMNAHSSAGAATTIEIAKGYLKASALYLERVQSRRQAAEYLYAISDEFAGAVPDSEITSMITGAR